MNLAAVSQFPIIKNDSYIFYNVDDELKKHCIRVGQMSLLLSKELELKRNIQNQIYLAAMMHDIGKPLLNQDILKKQGKLTIAEWQHVQKHVIYGTLRALELGYNSRIIRYIYYHHENFDNTGYPSGIKGKKIPIGSRIIRICDTFDALTEERPYRKALTIDEALEVMENERSYYDSDIYEVFNKIIRKGVHSEHLQKLILK